MYSINIEVSMPLNVVHEHPAVGRVGGGGEVHTFMEVPHMPARLAPTKTAIDLHMLQSIYCPTELLKYYQHKNI